MATKKQKQKPILYAFRIVWDEKERFVYAYSQNQAQEIIKKLYGGTADYICLSFVKPHRIGRNLCVNNAKDIFQAAI